MLPMLFDRINNLIAGKVGERGRVGGRFDRTQGFDGLASAHAVANVPRFI
jgi:hypothetical protein